MTILNWISIKCNCNYEFKFELPKSITTWMYPEMVRTLVDGGYSQTSCPECGISVIINGAIMVNTPKGIVTMPTGPPEKLIDILHKLEIVDETGKPFFSQEISNSLQNNMQNLDKNPLLKEQAEMNKIFKEPKKYFEKILVGEKEKKKRFGLF
ncbi:MAG: CpXC domain-containing protein [Candidatus Hodarchaeales archaeon]